MSRVTYTRKSTATHRAVCLFGIYLIMWSSWTLVRAQVTTADVVGTVSDPSGAALPKVTITITNAGTHDTRTTQSDSAGQYTFTLLPSGQYKLTAGASGFRNVVANITLSAGETTASLTRAEMA